MIGLPGRIVFLELFTSDAPIPLRPLTGKGGVGVIAAVMAESLAGRKDSLKKTNGRNVAIKTE